MQYFWAIFVQFLFVNVSFMETRRLFESVTSYTLWSPNSIKLLSFQNMNWQQFIYSGFRISSHAFFAIKSPLLSRLLHSFFNLIIGKFLIETDKYIRPWITSDLWRFEPLHCLNFFSSHIIPQNQNIHQFWTKLFLLFWWNFEKNGEKIRNCNPEFRIPGYKLIEWKRKIYWHWNSVFQKNPYYAYSHGTVSIYYP